MALNRAKRRELARNGKLEQYMDEVYQEQYEKVRAHAYTHAWASMMLALVDRFPGLMTADMLHSIAVDTLEYTNGIEPASELGKKLLERTGFDIYERPSQSERQYIEKQESENEHGVPR